MQRQGLAENELRRGEFEREISTESLQVFDDMRPGREEVGQHGNTRRPLLDAATSALGNCRFGQFEIRDFDDRVMRAAADRKGQIDQVTIGLWPATSVSNQQRG